jgi:hypothetical protein
MAAKSRALTDREHDFAQHITAMVNRRRAAAPMP